ncbi:purine permease, putative [Talaromyces stipitatus ATCC 10500]|uniref:Purine permease, putative n=1 Tax=Talaromyces stipitatus (strain ATCC 10500 / CBS 375.48 / QM 6759 / NRRL 1006) TaxID=441959 RepID=B8MM77_TALSN|nr:purine permease, putative [Talaromyces stipitatus ATCC 10500]EED13589.1 purine permease, putative [Talaromyces stipitatus ATCC 10500]
MEPSKKKVATSERPDAQSSSSVTENVSSSRWEYLKHYFTSRDGWIGDYDYMYLITPNIWPLNRKYKDFETPFYGLNDHVPIFLTIILGLQHALTLVGSVVSPPLAIAGGAFYLDSEQTQYLVSTAFITTGIATALQVTRLHVMKTPFFIGTGLLSVVGPTFDILNIAFNYTNMRYADGTCPVDETGAKLPCPEAWGAMLGTMLCTVWVQILMSLVPPKILNRIFPKIVTGSLLVLVGVYLIGNGMENWGGSSNCNGGTGFYALCPNTAAPNPLPWGDPKLIGLGFSVFITIIFVEIFGSPLMRSASVIFGLAVGCIISGAAGYWSRNEIDAAPVGTFLWVHTFKLSVDRALVLPLMIMFVCEAVSCMPDILATAELSGVDIDGTEFNSRIQGGILCDGLGSLISALGTGLPMVSQAGNNGVISLTGCASRRAGWCASAFLILMGIFGKFGAGFGSMPPSVLGGMQVFLYSTIAIAGIRVLSLVEFTRRNRFILTAALGIGFIDIVSPTWFSKILDYNGSNVNLRGFEQGLNLIVETPFIIAAVIGVVLNLALPEEKGATKNTHMLPWQ